MGAVHTLILGFIRAIAVTAVAVAAPTPAAAQMEWNGSQTTSWFNGANWNPVGVPGATDDVVIDTVKPNFTLIGLADADAAAVIVGDFGLGQLLIDSGRTLSSGDIGRIGNEPGSHGQVSVSGAGSLWDLDPHTLAVGSSGTGNLYVQNGGRIQANFIGIGNQAGSLGTVAVTGTQSEIDHTGNIVVGVGGVGTLDIADGGRVTSGSVGAVGSSQGQGDATIDGAGSSWDLAENLYIGGAGEGNTVTISDNAKVINAHGTIGRNANHAGTVTVTGMGSAWNNSGSLTIGDEGAGTLIIEDGAAVSNAQARIALEEGSQGTVTVSGTGTTWTSGFMSVGRRGDGALTIASGGDVNAGFGAEIGLHAPAEGVVTVSGSGSTWTVGGILSIGELSGAGRLIIEDGAVVDTSAWSVVGLSDQTLGDVLVTGAGSSWQIGDDLTVGGHQNAEAALTIAEGAAVTVEGAVAVADVNTGTGCACRLRVDGTLLADDGNVVHEGGWLGGAGVIGEDTTTIAGTVAPGDTVGTLSTSGLFFESSAVLEFELDEPGGAGDRISVVGPPGGLTLDGTLQVSDLGGFGEGVYTLIEYAGMLQDNMLTIGSLPSGFTATVDTSTAGQVNLVVTQLPDDVFADRFE